MAVPIVALQAARRIAYDAALIGSTEANYAGDCERPFIVDVRGVGPLLTKRLRALVDDPFIDWADDWGFLPGQAIHHTDMVPAVLSASMKVRCRKCPRCLLARAKLWTARAFVEIGQASRTWFGTLTVGPERRFWAKAAAESHCRRTRSEHFGMLTPEERFRAIERFTSPEVTRWLKRVRKNSGVQLRYFLTSEKHKDGFPHYHIVLHEDAGAVTKRTLQDAWTWGFSKFNLVPRTDAGSAAWYVAKYLSKDAQTRVRASRRYGQLQKQYVTEALDDASESEVNTRRRANGGGRATL